MAGQVKSRRTNNSVIDRFEENSLGVRDKGIGEVLMIKDYRNDDSFETETRNWWIAEEGQEEIDRP